MPAAKLPIDCAIFLLAVIPGLWLNTLVTLTDWERFPEAEINADGLKVRVFINSSFVILTTSTEIT